MCQGYNQVRSLPHWIPLVWLGVGVGIITMFVAIFYSLEDGTDLRTWEEIRFAKRIFFAGATTALIAPVIGYLIDLRWRRASSGKKPTPRDDLA